MSTPQDTTKLRDRLTPHRQERRAQKMEARRIVAAQLQGQINLFGTMTGSFIGMGLWRRLRWLVVGARQGRF